MNTPTRTLTTIARLGWLTLALAITGHAEETAGPVPPLARARFVVPPAVVVPHSPQRSFIGPGTIALETGDILMAAPWGRPPTDFEQLAAKYPVPMLYRSKDGGRTWQESGRIAMAWSLPGMMSDGGVSFLRLQDGRLALLTHRHVAGLHGGGLPVIAFSKDNGETFTPAQIIGAPEGVWYLMNDRLIQLRRGRLVVPVAYRPESDGKYIEGDRTIGLCFFSDDAGRTWASSRVPAKLGDKRGMAEPAVAEVGEGRLLMLARTGSGFLYSSWSGDGGETWSEPQATTLRSPCSSLTLKTLPDGRLIVFYNHAAPLSEGAFFPRTPLCYAVSPDGGKTWGPPFIIDDDGVEKKDRQNIYASASFTKEGMVLVWSSHLADPNGTFAGQYHPAIGGGKRAIVAYPEPSPRVLRVLPLGDSITRGSYLRHYDSGPNAGQPVGLPSPEGGGYRRSLQDKLRQAGIAFDFVGDLSYDAYGNAGVVDPNFDPDHHGLAGFSNQRIIDGGVVPTPPDVLASLGVDQVTVPGIADVLARHRPDVILLMSGANGFDAAARDRLITTIGEHSRAQLLVATILPQKAPRLGWENVAKYNQSLPACVDARRQAGQRVTLVDLHGAISPDDLLVDGIHPSQAGMDKIAEVWFQAIRQSLAVQPAR